MSTREKTISLIDAMTDEQVEALYIMLSTDLCNESMFNKETLEALEEIEDMKLHPENYKSYTDVDEMFEDILNEL